jgi:hypothetical protein
MLLYLVLEDLFHLPFGLTGEDGSNFTNKEIYAQKVFILFVVASYTCIQQVLNPQPHPSTHYIGWKFQLSQSS